MIYKYETHLHSAPVSRCAKAPLSESLPFYKKKGYDGVFLTNHFLNGNFGGNRTLSRQEQIDFYCKEYFDGLQLASEIGIKLFFGVEMTFNERCDFLIYGLSPEWYCEHPEILDLTPQNALDLLRYNGAFVVHAHPFREISSDAISLYPRFTDAVEIINSENYNSENKMAQLYAKHYKLPTLAGSDNHIGALQKKLSGIQTKEPLFSVEDFIAAVKANKYKLFEK